jgi:lambda family phage portal protein
MNELLLDRIISYVSPERGLKRKTLRAKEQYFKRFYDGAEFGRRTKNFIAPKTSANTESRYGLSVRDRARDLVRNNPYAHAALRAIVNSTVGVGIRPQIRCEDSIKREKIKSLWKNWAESTAIDFDGQKDFYQIQSMVMRTVVESGECLVRIRKGKTDSLIPFSLQVLEPDFLDTTREYRISENSYVIQGVEIQNEKVVAYWLYPDHPGGAINTTYSGVSHRIPAEEILFIRRQERPGQLRSISWFHPCLLALRDLFEYQSTVLLQQKLSNCFSVFIRNPDLATDPLSSTEQEELKELSPGLIYKLAIGEDVQFAAPPAPATSYSEYCNHILRSIATSLGITFEVLNQDYSTVNYSSGRMGHLQMSQNIDSWRWQMLIPQLCSPVWKLFERGLTIQGIDLSDVEVSYTPPRREMLNVSEETESIKEAMRCGLMTLSEALRELGEDPQSHLEELASDFKTLKQLGLRLECDPSHDQKPEASQKPIQS